MSAYECVCKCLYVSVSVCLRECVSLLAWVRACDIQKGLNFQTSDFETNSPLAVLLPVPPRVTVSPTLASLSLSPIVNKFVSLFYLARCCCWCGYAQAHTGPFLGKATRRRKKIKLWPIQLNLNGKISILNFQCLHYTSCIQCFVLLRDTKDMSYKSIVRKSWAEFAYLRPQESSKCFFEISFYQNIII